MMLLVCKFCGESFTAYDNRRRCYCPNCQKSSARYNKQFGNRLKGDPVLQIYTAHYKKRHSLYKKRKICKSDIDCWRKLAKQQQHLISTGTISVDDFKNWCEQTYNALIKNKE